MIPEDVEERSRWYTKDSKTALASFDSSTGREWDLVDETDIILDTSTDEFVVVLSPEGNPVRVRTSSDSGKKLLIARGAYSELEWRHKK
jgi:hypothetical protein